MAYNILNPFEIPTMSNELNDFLHYRALSIKHQNTQSFSRVIEQMADKNLIPETKQVCTVLAVPTVERLDALIAQLGMSKRHFVEMAILDAMQLADDILAAHDVDSYYEIQAHKGSKL